MTAYPSAETDRGTLVLADARLGAAQLDGESVDLAFFGPPYNSASLGATGNEEIRSASDYCEWMSALFAELARVLKPDGSVVIELGLSWQPGAKVRAHDGIQFLAQLLSRGDWLLVQDFYHYTPDFREQRADLVVDPRIRLKSSVTTLWWLSRSPDVTADYRDVADYGNSLTGIGSNLVTVHESSMDYEFVESSEGASHRDRMPLNAARFFIQLLTTTDQVVLDPFAGFGTTPVACELLGRRWRGFEHDEARFEEAARRLDAFGARYLSGRREAQGDRPDGGVGAS